MPEISRFYGIVIQFFYKEHLPPHLHATYGEYRIQVDINNISVLSGEMPRKGLNLIFEWVEIHQKELLEIWTLAKQEKPLPKVEPLK
jgi:hypothetical protein